jgi:hypothetical protein
MKHRAFAVAALALAVAGSTLAFDPPRNTRNGQAKQGQQGQTNGKRTGPQDGTGPIHAPGTGGGNGQGNGKMTGPRDGSGPIHTPGTGGGNGGGMRGGRR